MRCEQFIIPEDRNIFGSECDVLLHLISPSGAACDDTDHCKDPDPEEDRLQSEGSEREKRVNCFPRFPVEFSQVEIYMGFYVS